MYASIWGGSVHSPVYASVDLDTGDISRLHYGEPSPHDYDDLTKPIIKQNLSDYAKNCDLWGLTQRLGKMAGIEIDMEAIQHKYGSVVRKVE